MIWRGQDSRTWKAVVAQSAEIFGIGLGGAESWKRRVSWRGDWSSLESSGGRQTPCWQEKTLKTFRIASGSPGLGAQAGSGKKHKPQSKQVQGDSQQEPPQTVRQKDKTRQTWGETHRYLIPPAQSPPTSDQECATGERATGEETSERGTQTENWFYPHQEDLPLNTPRETPG